MAAAPGDGGMRIRGMRAQRLAHNCGESTAVWAGIRAARGDYVITMDADLQNDPGGDPALCAGAGSL